MAFNPSTSYIHEIKQYFTDSNSSEHSYRTTFENYLKEIFPENDGYRTQQDQRSIQGNKPDFVITKNKIPVLYIEVKKVGEDLDKIEKSSQANRYFGYDNLIISDYVNFRFYRYGERYGGEISLGDIDKKNLSISKNEKTKDIQSLTLEIKGFIAEHKEPIKSGVLLSKIMGGMARRIRENTLDMLTSGSDRYVDLDRMKKVVQDNLISGLSDADFADMYAQTLVYGLFAARYNDKTQDTFSRIEARELIPKTNPFLANFFDHIAGVSFPERLKFIVNELCEVFSHADVVKLVTAFYKKEKDNKDPIIHFYEDFLKEYDEKKKMEMGVFYTPKPVVQFIVRGVDEILKKEFGIAKGLSDTSKISIKKEEVNETTGKVIKGQKEYHRVQILDVATGTGTFLNEVVNFIQKGFAGQEGRWDSYVKQDLIPRLHGFELMMASYTIAHLKLGMTFQDSGVKDLNQRLGIYLTNTLDTPTAVSLQGSLFGAMESIAEESKLASQVKSELPIMCVIGNPPYSGISMNKHYTDNNVYKVEVGGREKLKEKKNWLDDDYVKFIRFGESLIEKNQEGILGMITAHGYIDNPTFRGMRWHLRNTFDAIYVVDLHGNSNKKEVSPDGSKDENVFDIKTGVSIIFGVKKKIEGKNKKLATVYQVDVYGDRKSKYENIDRATIENLTWNELPEDCEVWKVEGKGKEEYMKGFSVAEMFSKNTTGIVTMGDSFIIDENKDVLRKRVEDFLYNDISENELKEKYDLGKNYAKWVVDNKKKIEIDDSKIVPLSYRPFDTRWTYFDKNLVWRTRDQTMIHLVGRDNVGLIASRINRQASLGYVFVSKILTDFHILDNAQDSTSVFPLYLFDLNGNKIPNINQELLLNISKKIGDISPENLLDYIYAILHSKNYREKYKEFLKTDFPRVSHPQSKEEFWKLAPLGTKLRELHLMNESSLPDNTITYPEAGTDIVEKITYTDSKVYINSTQYFGNVSKIAWDFYIGGYQPAQKWLKDRKDRKLSNEDIEHYQRIIGILVGTEEGMREIDKVIKI